MDRICTTMSEVAPAAIAQCVSPNGNPGSPLSRVCDRCRSRTTRRRFGYARRDSDFWRGPGPELMAFVLRGGERAPKGRGPFLRSPRVGELAAWPRGAFFRATVVAGAGLRRRRRGALDERSASLFRPTVVARAGLRRWRRGALDERGTSLIRATVVA